MTIGAVAEQAGRRPSAIRYYEQIGLLPPPDRVSGRRVYGPDTLRTLAVIETGQRAGLTLDEIRALLAATPDDQAAIERLRELAVRKLPQVRELIERTELVRGWLEAAARCECPSLDDCPLFGDPPGGGNTPVDDAVIRADARGDVHVHFALRLRIVISRHSSNRVPTGPHSLRRRAGPYDLIRVLIYVSVCRLLSSE
jgi:DNA-binding transcriptional MerR regulator